MNWLKRLLRNDRGAIMIFGVFAGTLLVGALWHLASVGDAIFWRERAQDAADAGAFENAVWNARGMNLLVTINLVMEVALAALVLWRMAMIIVAAGIIILTILAFFTDGATAAAAGKLADIEGRMLDKDGDVSNAVMKILGSLRIAEYAVSEAAPVLAFGFSGSDTQGFYPAVTSATTWSGSLMPSLSLQAIKDIKECLSSGKPSEEGGSTGGTAGGGTTGGGETKGPDPTKWEKFLDKYKAGLAIYNDYASMPRLSMPLSLPVEAGDSDELCGKVGEDIGKAFAEVIKDAIHVSIPDRALNIVSKMVEKNPEVFCLPMEAGSGAMDDALDELTKGVGDKCKDDLGKDTGAVISGGDPDNPQYHEYGHDNDGKAVSKDDWLKACKDDKVKQSKDKLEAGVKQAADAAKLCGQPVDVWKLATNGNVFMRSFSSITQAETMSKHDDKGIDVADGTRTGNVTPVTVGTVGAHAEMYYDTKDAWGDAAGEAMWNLLWKARLRRMQPLQNLAATAAGPFVEETFKKMLGKGLDEIMDQFLTKDAEIPKEDLPDVKKLLLWDQIKKADVGLGNTYIGEPTGNKLRDFLLDHGGTNAVVH